MEAIFPWIPFGIDAPDEAKTGRLVIHGEEFQLLRDQGSERTILLTPANSGFASNLREITPDEDHSDHVGEIDFSDVLYLAVTFAEQDHPVRVSDIPKNATQQSATELLNLGAAISEIVARGEEFAWGEAIYLPEYGKCIPTTRDSDGEVRHALAIKILTGGVEDTSLSVAQIHAVNQWISEDEIRQFLSLLGFKTSEDGRGRVEAPRAPSEFSLPGRLVLEEFFREYVIDHFWQKDRYDALGVKPPGGILLYGPPGTGKTFAVRELSKFLGWPVFDIDMGKVGSPYIHQTSVAIRNLFENAFEQAPSLILIDEVDAFVGDRNRVGQDHKIEEVSEFLRLIESASDHGVIIFATTNRKDAIDDAIKRRGRFDHMIEVDYPAAEDIVTVLKALLANRPHVGGINLQIVAEKLTRRPMSDIAWVVNESARLAVKSEKEQIDDICLFQAIARLTES